VSQEQLEACNSVFKDTNPKDAIGVAKVPLSPVPAQVMAEVGLAMMEGALKYGRHNYRVAGVRASVYYDAALRHMMAWWEGEDIDPDSGLPHLVKAIACFVVLRDSQIQGNWVDDRPPRNPEGWVADLNEKAKALLEKYPNPVGAYTEIEMKNDERERITRIAEAAGERAARDDVEAFAGRVGPGSSGGGRILHDVPDFGPTGVLRGI
jgi:hypothetical protein